MMDFFSLPPAAQASLVMIDKVARRLGPDLLAQVAFLGGATLALHLTDPAVAEVRPTRDVDVIIEALTYGHYGEISERLRAKGFTEDTSIGAPICRWQVEGVILDVMPTSEEILGFSNRWYASALQNATPYLLPNIPDENQGAPAPTIHLVTAPYFLATKLEAYANRGNGDIYASRDIEDVVTLLDGRTQILEEIRSEIPDIVQEFIASSIQRFISLPNFAEAIEGHLPYEARNRLALVLNRLQQIAILQ